MPPTISLIPIYSLVNNVAETKPTTTSNANRIFTLPGSRISTERNVKKIDGNNQKIENNKIQMYIVLELNKEDDNSIDLPPGIKQKIINNTETKKDVNEVFSALLVVFAIWKQVVPNAHVIPAIIAIHSTNEDGINIPFSKPTIISSPINPNKIDSNRLNLKD